MDGSSLMDWDEIGIVAIGRNEGKRLIGCLASVRAKTRHIVYVDSGSTDGSVAAAEEFGVSIVELDLTKPFTAARARNEGFAALRVVEPNIRFVQFVDGDCILSEGWLEAATAFISQKEDVAIVCGRRRERSPETSIYNKMADLEWDTPVGEALACGGDALVRVAAFEAVEGFLPQLIAGEEPDLCVRLRDQGWKIWRLDAEMTQHDMAMTHFSQWWARTVRSGYGMAEVSWLHRMSPARIWKRETLSAIFWGGVVPVVIGFGALIHSAVLALLLIYPVQIFRVAFREGVFTRESWLYAVFMTLAKFAALQGHLKLLWRRWRGGAIRLIEYK